MVTIVVYRFTEGKRNYRNAVAKTLLDYGSRVQYSTFECILDAAMLDEMIGRLTGIVSGEASVRIY